MASAATSLVCRNCGAQVPLRPQHACYECFGPLELGWAKAKQMTTFNLVVLRVLMYSVGRFNPDMIRKLLQQ